MAKHCIEYNRQSDKKPTQKRGEAVPDLLVEPVVLLLLQARC